MPLSPEQLKQRAQPWLEPISPEAPTGQSARVEPAYEAVLAEIAKLDSLSGGAVDWATVLDKSSTLLKTRTKDLLLACYLAAGLQAKDDLEGLATGLSAVAELMDLYWQTLFPEVARLRARINALAWLVTRAATQVGNARSPQAEAVSSLGVAAARLAEVTRAKLDDKGPAMGPLLEAIKRLELSAPAPAPSPVARPPQAAALPSTAPSAEGLGADAVPAFLRQVGQSVVTAATELYRANNADPLAYRLSRVGLWLHVIDAPPRGPGGSTSVPPLPANTRAQLERLAANGKWQELLDEAEGAMRLFRFCLDLQQLTCRALAGLGKSHEAARAAVLTELASLTRRLPSLLELTASDGSPFAGPQTREWISEEVQGKPVAAPQAPTAAAEAGGTPEAVAQARALLKQGQAAEAVALLQARLSGAATARERFVLRLAQARLCAEGGQPLVARGLYAALDQEGAARGLDAWEPRLAIECLEGLLTCARILSKALPAELMGQYHRLCQLDPAVAQRVGSERS